MTAGLSAAGRQRLAEVVAEGLFDLEDPVDRVLPELADRRVLREPSGPVDDTVPAERPVTVRDLLTFPTRSWGYGVCVRDAGAFGWGGGLGTSWLVDPRLDLTVTVLSRRMFETSDLPAAHRRVREVVYAELAAA